MIYLIGASGFIGKNLQEALSASKTPYICGDINLPGDGFIDVSDYSTFSEKEGVSCLINLAAEHRDDVRPVSKYYDVNVKGAENVVMYCKSQGIEKIIFTSSVAVYGESTTLNDESAPINFFNDYGESKFKAEQVYRAWAEEVPTRSLIIIRPTVVFGEGNRGNVFNLLQQIHSKKFMMIGQGKNKKSMAYVRNLAAFLVFCERLGSGVHTFNYVDGPDLSVRELVTLVREKLGRGTGVGLTLPVLLGAAVGAFFDLLSRLSGMSFPISQVRVRKFVSNSSFTSASRTVGFEPPYTLEQGLLNTLEYEFGGDKGGAK